MKSVLVGALTALGLACGCSTSPEPIPPFQPEMPAGGGSNSDGSSPDNASSDGGSPGAPSVVESDGGESATNDAASAKSSDPSTTRSDASSCALSCRGCCDLSGTCHPDGSQNTACGTLGATCAICLGGQTCTSGKCSAPPPPPDAGANSCSTKTCYDMYDCMLQGCATGCSGFPGNCK